MLLEKSKGQLTCTHLNNSEVEPVDELLEDMDETMRASANTFSALLVWNLGPIKIEPNIGRDTIPVRQVLQKEVSFSITTSQGP